MPFMNCFRIFLWIVSETLCSGSLIYIYETFFFLYSSNFCILISTFKITYSCRMKVNGCIESILFPVKAVCFFFFAFGVVLVF